jgi:putative hydrolase of the HAD superfamily
MAGFTGVAAITFDGDGTLWDFESAMRTALERSAEILVEAGLRRGEGPVEAKWLAGIRDEVASSPQFSGASMEAIRLAAFAEAVRRCDPERLGLAQSAYRQYMKDRFTELRPYPDVAGALSILQRRFQLALVTNGNTHPSRLGLEQKFAQVVIAFECGIEKPDPGIYTLAVRRLGVEAAACVHVGDDPDEDVESARRAGMRSIWINREGKPWPESLSSPDAEIRDLSSLPDLL